MTFAEKLQQLRKQKNLSQEALAELLDISRQAISKWESGAVMPELDKLIRLSEVFEVTLDYLVKDDAVRVDPPKPESPKPTPKSMFNFPKNIFQLWVELMVISLSFLGIALIWLLSILKPAYFGKRVGFSGDAYGGLMGFLLVNQLNALFFVLLVLFFGTIGLLIVQYYRRNKVKMHAGLALIYICAAGLTGLFIAGSSIPGVTKITYNSFVRIFFISVPGSPFPILIACFVLIGIAGLIVSGIRFLVRRTKRANQ